MPSCLRGGQKLRHPVNAVIEELGFDRGHGVSRLRTHDVTLRGKHVTLRPMTEGDWDLLVRLNNDPEVMKYADSNEFEEKTRGEVQAIYRWISTHAYCFIIEVEDRPIGECWLQRMNLRRIVDQFPGEDLRRIDLAIGEKRLWGRGHGAEAIGLLVGFGFRDESVSAIFGLVLADNRRSLRAFQKNGFERHAVTEEDDGTSGHDLIVRRADRRSFAKRGALVL